MPHRTIAILLGASSLLVPLFAQGTTTERTTGLLPPDAPELYQSFLHFHEGLSAVLQKKKDLDPALGKRVEKGVALDYGIRLEELQKITDAAHGLAADLAGWQNDVKSQVEQARLKSQRPEAETMRQLSESRRRLIETAILRLSTGLSAESWAALRAYINNVHRQRITVGGFKSPPTTGQVQ